MSIRTKIEDNEHKILSPRAAFSSKSRGRVHPEEECDIRTVYMRDRDRILHSEAFRRLKHKTQVFLIAANDLYRTRLTHSLEVAGISRTIAKALRLNEDLTEAISLGHDLGHPPFGHVGEAVLNDLYPNGFRHNIQSVRVVDRLEGGRGLNLCYETRDGILKHSKGMSGMNPEAHKERADTLEGQIVRIADRISYLNHDLDDAIRSKMLQMKDVPDSILKLLGKRYSQRINTMVVDVISTSETGDHIEMSPDVLSETEKLKDFLYDRVYNHPTIREEARKARKIITDLYDFYMASPHIVEEKTAHITYHNTPTERRVVDYIAMMTDSYALRSHQHYLTPKKWFKLEP